MKPPIGHPMPGLDLTIVLEDEYGTLYHDERGFMWRGPEYVQRYDQFRQLDPAMTGGWQKLGNWFRTRKANPQYAPGMLDQVVDKLTHSEGDRPGAAERVGSKLVYGALALGALYVGVQVMGARGWKI